MYLIKMETVWENLEAKEKNQDNLSNQKACRI